MYTSWLHCSRLRVLVKGEFQSTGIRHPAEPPRAAPPCTNKPESGKTGIWQLLLLLKYIEQVILLVKVVVAVVFAILESGKTGF